MKTRYSTVKDLLKSRLSRQITRWVFVSIVVVEVLILLPSVYRREREIVQHLEEVGLASVAPLVRLCGSQVTQERIRQVAKQLMLDSVVKGGVVYMADGERLGSFGETPVLRFADLMGSPEMRYRTPDGNRHELAMSTQEFGNDYILIVRLDSSEVKWQLKAFVARIAGLVLIICVFVTVATMITLGIIVIDPILKLRQALIAVGEAPGEDNGNLACYSLGVKRQDELGEVMLTFNDMRHQISSYVRQIKEREKQLENLVMELGVARDRAEKLLLNILPDPIAEQLKQGVYPIAESFGQATVLFADLVGFTELAGHIPAVKLVELLNEIFSAFDQLADKHGLEKIKTIGDAYMVVGGIPTPRPDHAEAIAHMALDMQQEVRRLAALKSEALSIRIGIHTGPVIAGVIGIKKFIYDLWGDTVNIASRMESHGIAGCIQVSETTYHRLQQQFRFQSRGPIAIKGKGKMQTYLLIEKLNPTPDETPTHTKPSTRGTLEHLEILKPALEEEDLAN